MSTRKVGRPSNCPRKTGTLKRIDRLIIQELAGPWGFGVAIFTVLIMAGTYLLKVTDFIVQGVSVGTVLEFTLLLLPGILAKTFPMAILLATLLAFGRLSSDSEIVALRAAGTSIGRIMVPVGAFAVLVAIVAFGLNELIVPNAAVRKSALEAEIARALERIQGKPTFYPVYEAGQLMALVSAQEFNFTQGTLKGAVVTSLDKESNPTYTLYARELVFSPNREGGIKDWRIRNGAVLQSADGKTHIQIEGDAWPTEVNEINATPLDILSQTQKDPDLQSMSQLQVQIDRARENPKIAKSQIANLEYIYYNKIALPLAAIVYALVGAPLGIRNHRTAAASGFWISVIIIFGYMMLANFMAVYAQGGVIPAWLASFTPIVIGLVVAAIAIHRKNG